MKKFTLLIALMLSTIGAMAQQTADSNGRFHGLNFGVDLGYNINTKGGGGSIAAEVELGKYFGQKFYWGIGSGAYIPTGDGKVMIPITTNAKVFMPLNSSKITPFVDLKAGYVINTADDVTVGEGKFSQKVEMPDYIMVQIMPGFRYPLTNGIDFNFGAGYTHFIPASGGDNFGVIAVRAGFAFHKSSTSTKTKLPPVPTRDQGYQVTVEGGWLFGGDEYKGPAAPTIVASYKMNPNLSVGVGFGLDNTETFVEEGIRDHIVSSNGRENNESDAISLTTWAYKFFARGQYRLNDNRLSPFASCDAGIRFYSYDDSDYNGDKFSRFDNELGKAPSSSFFISPAIGLSLRTTNNSYVELKAGYTMATGGGSGHHEYEEVVDRNLTSKHSIVRDGVSFSAPFISLGWTHTFGSRKR